MQRVINFSGGLTSAYMTIKNYKEGDIVLFCDTGREHPLTYKFVDDFERNEGIPIKRLKYKDYENAFQGMLDEFKGKKIPNFSMRSCTELLKVRTAKAYLRSIGVKFYINMIGFRYDEKNRLQNDRGGGTSVIEYFPLIEDKIVKKDILDYWANKPYTLEIPSILGNCVLCFMKGENALIKIMAMYPEFAKEWIDNEEESEELGYNRTYIRGVKYKELFKIAQDYAQSKREKGETIDFSSDTPKYSCKCG